jgi:hypothetical protein
MHTSGGMRKDLKKNLAEKITKNCCLVGIKKQVINHA